MRQKKSLILNYEIDYFEYFYIQSDSPILCSPSFFPLNNLINKNTFIQILKIGI